MHDLSPLYEAVVSGDAQMTRALADQALAGNVAALRLLNESLMPAMAEVGRSGAVTVARMVMGLPATHRPGVHLCTR